ncbi:MAG TPA: sialate O-acetylesterase [Bacteroidales bacterium]|nr:sialate O-acetylesterase [Bacteroidales bacterium]
MKKYLFSVLTLICMSMQGQITMPKVFSNHMVLQRDINIPVWGGATPGTTVIAELNGVQVMGITDEAGKWMVHFPKFKAGGPYSLKVTEKGKKSYAFEFSDVMIGDVWLASGQSNMEWQVQQAKDAGTEIKNANYPNIRFFSVPHDIALKVLSDTKSSSWQLCDTNNVKTFSAVAYYFAREINKDEHVAIGIVQSTWGGTPVEAWTSREILLSSSITRKRILDNDSLTELHLKNEETNLKRFWEIVYNPQNGMDTIVPKENYVDKDWRTISMPSTFKQWGMPPYEGIMWLRKTITLPESFAGKDLTIYLGHPEINYSLYFNGQNICKTIWNAALTHYYTIPGKLVKAGNNLISVRMSLLWNAGGFNPPAVEMFITDGNEKVSIAGDWDTNIKLEPAVPKIFNFQYYPTILFNAMLNPVIPYGLKGFLWYQGEANDSAPAHYRSLLPMMVADWRIRWQQGYLPFLIVQLPNYMKPCTEPQEKSNWAEMREAQQLATLQPNVGIACTIDIGEENSIHPINKQDVGHRLALQAKKLVYGHDVIASGPVFTNMEINGNEITLNFTSTGAGLVTKNNAALKGFAIAGENKKFVWADARIVGNTIVVSAKSIAKPVAVRYNWADNPAGNLYNKEGLPALPFRTDCW